jgi:hypothetical protein
MTAYFSYFFVATLDYKNYNVQSSKIYKYNDEIKKIKNKIMS